MTHNDLDYWAICQEGPSFLTSNKGLSQVYFYRITLVFNNTIDHIAQTNSVNNNCKSAALETAIFYVPFFFTVLLCICALYGVGVLQIQIYDYYNNNR